MKKVRCAFQSAQNLAIMTPTKESHCHGRRNCKDTKPSMSSLLVLNRVYRLEIQSVMLVFSIPLPSLWPLPPSPLPKVNVQYIKTVCDCGGGGVLSCVVGHILQEFNTLFLTRFRTYNIASPPQTKTPLKTTFRDWCLYNVVPSSMVTAFFYFLKSKTTFIGAGTEFWSGALRLYSKRNSWP